MRVNKIAIGAVIAATLLLTGCGSSSDNTAGKNESGSADKTESSAASTSDAGNKSNSDCPELKEGVTISVTQWVTCATENAKDSAGYAAKNEGLTGTQIIHANPTENAVSSEGQAASFVRIGDKSWVKSTGDWQESDPNSSDPMISALSKAAAAAGDLDPVAALKDATGDLKVTGTGERLGKKVFILTGDVAVQGVTTKVTSEMTSDYIGLASSTETDMNGQSLTSKYEVTEWDKKQDIQPPK